MLTPEHRLKPVPPWKHLVAQALACAGPEALRTSAAIGVLTLAIVLYFWKLVFTHQFDWMWAPDAAQQVLPWFEIQARQFHAGHLPLWDSSFWCGQPFFGQLQPGSAYPLNWILFALPLDAAGNIARASLQWYFVAIHVMAGAFAFLLCRDLGRSRGASIIGGLLFALGGYIGHADWPQKLNGAVWAPLVFLYLFRITRRHRPLGSAVWAGVFLGFAWLSGHHEIPLYTSYAALFLFLWMAIRNRADRWRVIGWAAVFFAFTAGVGAFQILPAYEYGRLATRFGAPGGFQWNQFVPYAVHALYSLDPLGVPGLVFPTVRSDLVVFVGVTALALGLLGAAGNWTLAPVRTSAVLAISGLLYALGGSNVFQGVLYSIAPELNRGRNPESAIFLFDIGLAVLLAFGVDALYLPKLRLRLLRGLLVFAIPTYAVLTAMTLADVLKADSAVAMAPLAALLLAGILWALSRGMGRTLAHVFIGMLLMIELGATARYRIADKGEQDRMRFLDQMKSNGDIAAFLNRQPGPFRIRAESADLPENWAGMFGLESLSGYLGGVTNNILSLDVSDPRRQQLLGVRYLIAKEPPQRPVIEVFRGASGLRVFEDDAAFPRAWITHETAPLPATGERIPLRNVDNARLRNMAYISGPQPPVRTCTSADDVRYQKTFPGDNTFLVTTACEGILVFAETWFPGWRGWVDGRSSPVRQIDGALLGIFVPVGNHAVGLKYRPWSVFGGAWISVATLLSALLFELVSHRRFLSGVS